MDTERIIKILSNHHQPHCLEYPQALRLQSIVSLVEHSLSPNHTLDSDRIRECLQELQAQGEILAGSGNQFCMAPPTILVGDETNLTEVLFKGDRAYLKLAHKALETGQPIIRTQLHPKIHGFHRIKECLKNHGIRLLTASDSIEHLPQPEKPKLYLLFSKIWHENPFQILGQVEQYIPQAWRSQKERWQQIERTDQILSQLIQLSTGEYLWFEADQFYELTPDTASSAMFWLDQKAGLPVQVPWDKTPGRLNLQGIILPSSYAQWFWQLSEPDPDQPRTWLFTSHHATVCQALTRLGCTLV